MWKKMAFLTVVTSLLVLAGCDPGSNTFSKKDQSASRTQVALLTPNNAKEMK